MEAEQIERTTKQEVLNSEDHSKKAHEALQVAEGLLQEQNQESKQLEVRLREEASKGDHKAAMDAAAIAAARALLELVPFKDPSQSVPNHTEAPSVFTEAYNQNRTDESRHREAAGAAGLEEEPASPASPSPDSPEAVPTAPAEEEKARGSQRRSFGRGSPTVILDLRDAPRFEAEGQAEAVSAFKRLGQLAERWKEDFQLRSGDLIVVNNKRAAHRWPSHAKLRLVQGSRGADQWQERVIK
eukprot:s1603_g13.t1